jgi:hypothetical protein
LKSNFEELVLGFQKTFRGTIVNEYPGKGFPLSQVETLIWEGDKLVNPPPVGGQLKTINMRFNK